MRLFHATTIAGLDILRANSRDREGNPVLYLTDNVPYSLFYIRDREIDFVTCGVREGGTVHYDEKFPNQLETLYRGMSGWIYEVDTDAVRTKINGIYVVHNDVVVLNKMYIPDVLKAIWDETEKDKVYILPYADLSAEQKRINQDGMVQWFLSDRNMNSRKKKFLRKHFPEAWEEAGRILDKSVHQCYDSKK